jgi:hypothetical protein
MPQDYFNGPAGGDDESRREVGGFLHEVQCYGAWGGITCVPQREVASSCNGGVSDGIALAQRACLIVAVGGADTLLWAVERGSDGPRHLIGRTGQVVGMWSGEQR